MLRGMQIGSFKSYNDKDGSFKKYLYYTVSSEGKYKLVKPLPDNKSSKPIEFAHSENSIYGVINDKGKLQSIQAFGADKNKIYQIDLLHSHDKMQPHVHDFKESNNKYHPKDGRVCNSDELATIDKINKLFKKYTEGKFNE